MMSMQKFIIREHVLLKTSLIKTVFLAIDALIPIS